MAILDKQRNEIQRYKQWVEKFIDLVGEAYEIKESFPELYQSSQKYSLDPDNQPTPSTGITAEDLLALGVNYTDLAAFANQPITKIVAFNEGDIVATREYGKDVRAIRQ